MSPQYTNPDALIGQVIDDRFEIRAFIDVGASSAVYEALDRQTGLDVAIKILKKSGEEEVELYSALRRMVTESQAIHSINHPNVVKIYYISVHTEMKYIVMELLRGVTLKHFCTDTYGAHRLVPEKEALNITCQVLSALEAAHASGVVHRDIKPQNIMVCEGGRVVVTDFGIAKMESANSNVTLAGKVVGTPLYISPEQAKGLVVDARSDIYSVGIMLYHMLTGRPPFDSNDKSDQGSIIILNKHIHEAPQPPRELTPEISRGCEQIILHALEKRPEARFDSAAHMEKAVKLLLIDPDKLFEPDFDLSPVTPAQKKRALVVTAVVSVAVFVVVAVIAIICILTALHVFREPPVASFEVKNYVGRSLSEAEGLLNSDGIAYKIAYKSSDSPEGEVISQSPKGGSMRKGEIAVTLTVSSGRPPETEPETPIETSPADDEPPEEITAAEVPTLVGLSEASARYALDAAGFAASVSYARSDVVPAGFVITQSLPYGTFARVGTTVTVVVSSGKN